MGNFGLSGLFRCALLSAVGLAAAFLAVAAAAQTAAAQDTPLPQNNAVSLKNWDSDNLRFGSGSFPKLGAESATSAGRPETRQSETGHTKTTKSAINDGKFCM